MKKYIGRENNEGYIHVNSATATHPDELITSFAKGVILADGRMKLEDIREAADAPDADLVGNVGMRRHIEEYYEAHRKNQKPLSDRQGRRIMQKVYEAGFVKTVIGSGISFDVTCVSSLDDFTQKNMTGADAKHLDNFTKNKPSEVSFGSETEISGTLLPKRR